MHTSFESIANLFVTASACGQGTKQMSSDIGTYSSRDEQALSSTERKVAALWCEVLQLPPFPRQSDNFFELGGDSMTMTMLEYRIQEELMVDLPVGALLGAPTLRELSTLIDGLDSRAAAR